MMTSWHDFPFEIKAQILAYYLDASISMDISWRSITPSGRFIINVRGFLEITPSLKDEAIRVLDEMLDWRYRFHMTLIERLKPVENTPDDDWNSKIDKACRRLNSRISGNRRRYDLLRWLQQDIADSIGQARRIRSRPMRHGDDLSWMPSLLQRISLQDAEERG